MWLFRTFIVMTRVCVPHIRVSLTTSAIYARETAHTIAHWINVNPYIMNIWMASYEWHEHKHERAQALTHISIPWMRMRMWSIWYRARAFDRWSCVIYLYVCFIRHFNEQSNGFIWPFCDMCSNTAIESIYFVSLSLWCLSQINDCSAWCANERERARVCVCVWQSHE